MCMHMYGCLNLKKDLEVNNMQFADFSHLKLYAEAFNCPLILHLVYYLIAAYCINVIFKRSN